MSKQIPLTKGQFALVDDADYDWLNQWRWRLNSKGYAIRSFWRKGREVVTSRHSVKKGLNPQWQPMIPQKPIE
jgi:hypothetical protein